MKYIQLTKEQLEALHEEFATFLATQQIDVKEWELIKTEKPEVAIEEINIFSDLVWEDVLTKAKYIEHFDAQSINLFCCEETAMFRIMIKATTDEVDFTTQEGIQWVLNNAKSNKIALYKGRKEYSKERNLEVFDLILKGAAINKEGVMYQNFEKLIS